MELTVSSKIGTSESKQLQSLIDTISKIANEETYMINQY
jgi:hypothetical protein